MSIRQKNGRWIVEIYDPTTKKKTYVKPSEFDVPAPTSERAARHLERMALNARDARRPGHNEETVGSFASRWTRDFPKGESTNKHNAQQVKGFVEKYRDRIIRSITRREARAWHLAHPSHTPALRKFFYDAYDDRVADECVFAKLARHKVRGREDITVLTLEEVHRLAEIAIEVHGREFGTDVAGAIVWAAYTQTRPGETYAARHSMLVGDVYHLRKQMNSTLGRETPPKHDSVGAIYVPEAAQEMVARLPRRIDDDLMFHTKRGKQFRQESWSRAWSLVRSAFMRELPVEHHLHERLALNPDDRFDFHELRHFGASYMLNVLEIEPWLIAKQLRHDDEGGLVIRLYGHPDRDAVIDQLRRGWGGNVRSLRRDLSARRRARDILGRTA